MVYGARRKLLKLCAIKIFDMNYKQIDLSYKKHVATITLNRPDKLNALSPVMRKEMFDAINKLEHYNNIRVLIITGASSAFCAGGDIEYLHKLRKDKNFIGFKKLLAEVKKLALAIHNLQIPVIAGINGAAAGAGLNLALACDIRISSETATFTAPFLKLGIHPDWGNIFLLTRIAGTAKTCEMLFTGEVISANEALQWGLVNKIVPSSELHNTINILASKIAGNSPLAVKSAKRSVYDALHRNLSDMLDMEEETQLQCFKSKDALEGISAFLEKRKPAFYW